jgi:hypothetical protein
MRPLREYVMPNNRLQHAAARRMKMPREWTFFRRRPKGAAEDLALIGSNILLTRRGLLATAVFAGVTATLLRSSSQGLSAQSPPANLPRVSIRRFGARGDGRPDDTFAFQAAHDSLPQGGTIIVDAGTYLVSRVTISHRYIRFELDADAVLRKAGGGGPAARGMFVVENLPEANFSLRGGRIDLNGEGPMGIGAAGRLGNVYAPQTVASVKAIAGPLNAALFALRSSHINVAEAVIENSGESGILIRNCSDTLVERCHFRNIANYGVEWSLVRPDEDQGDGPLPDRSRNYVRGCTFEDIDDYGLGSGNGAAAGGGGSSGGWVSDYGVTDCTFSRCQRDINFEFASGSGVAGLELRRLRSQDARQGGFGLVGVRDAIVGDYIILNPGYAPTAALGFAWPSIYGGFLSSDFRSVLLSNVHVIDQRGGRVRTGSDGEIAAGARRFRSRSAGFTDADAGTFIGIRGANPQGVCYVGRIVRCLSPSEVELDLPAAATVRGADYAYGGACREGLRLYHGTSATLENCRIEAGTQSGLPGEPPAAALRIEEVRDPVGFSASTVLAPRTAGTTPVGIDLIRASLSAPDGSGAANRVEGFLRSVAERH